MCGLAGTILYPQERPAEIWQAIKETFTQNLLFNEERGQDATGVAVVGQDGAVAIYKRPLPASQFVRTPTYHALLDNLDARTTLLLGHTRKPTKGDPDDLANDHPLHIGSIVGVHNGHIDNDDDLFDRFALPRQAEVDSEIIFRLLAAEQAPLDNPTYLQKIRPRLQSLQGKFTFLSTDLRVPHKLLVVKHKNPLSLHYHPGWRTLLFTSRYLFLRKTFGPGVINEQIPRDVILLFDALQLPKQTHCPTAQLPLQIDDPFDFYAPLSATTPS